MRIKRYLDYINEARGIADATISISNLILKSATKQAHNFVNGSLPEVKRKEIIIIPDTIKSDSLWKKFPVSRVELTHTYVKLTQEEYNARYPIASKIKQYNTYGSCSDMADPSDKESYDSDYNFDEVSIIEEDKTIFLKIEIGAFISEGFQPDEIEGLDIEIESAILHELNHAYEGLVLYNTTGTAIPTGITAALEINVDQVPKPIWKYWEDEFTFLYYWAEPHEVRAMIQESLPYTRRYKTIEELEKKCPSYRYMKYMVNFSSNKIKSGLIDLIKTHLPDKDPQSVLDGLKNGFAEELKTYNEASDQVSSVDPDDIMKASFDKFFQMAEERIHKAGEKIRRGVLRNYSNK